MSKLNFIVVVIILACIGFYTAYSYDANSAGVTATGAASVPAPATSTGASATGSATIGTTNSPTKTPDTINTTPRAVNSISDRTNSNTAATTTNGSSTNNGATSGSIAAQTNPNNDQIPEIVRSATWLNENAYWSKSYLSRPYYQQGVSYDNYEPAYEYGVNLYNQYNGRPFNDIDNSQLQTGWNSVKGGSVLDWGQAHDAIRDAYNRAYTENTANTGTNATRINSGTNSSTQVNPSGQ